MKVQRGEKKKKRKEKKRQAKGKLPQVLHAE